MNKLKKIFIILFVIFFTIATINIDVFATDNFDFNQFDTGSGGKADKVTQVVNNTAGTAISVARIVCVTIAIVILLVIAMKYMMSAPGDRADIKKHAIHYVIGAFILFAVTGILSILDGFAKAI